MDDITLLPERSMLFLPFRGCDGDNAEHLRVGVVIENGSLPKWVDALVVFLRQIPGIEVCLFTVENASGPKRVSWLADRVYSASRARFDPFESSSANGSETAVVAPVNTIRAAACGVVVWLAGAQDASLDLTNLAKHGVFTLRLGDRDRTIPFWDEVASNSLTSTATVFWHDSSFAEARAVRTSQTSTLQGLFVTENAEQPLVAAIRMLADLCMEIQRGSSRFEERVRDRPAHHLLATSGHNSPSNLEAAQFVLSKLTRSAYLRWRARGKKLRWFVAMRPSTGRSVADPSRMDWKDFQKVPLPKDVEEMADPFLWEAGGRQYLLFEELAAGGARGRLGCVEILRNGACSEMELVLERPYHLSYPCVVPSSGDLFLLPETSEAKRIDLYRFSRFPGEVELVSTPVEGVALVDTTPIFLEARWYFFTTTTEPFMETLLFSATKLEGPWDLHPSNPVSTSVRSCRSAGQLFWRDGRLFRPTQDCSVRYGYAITINEVTKLSPHEFKERPVSYIAPSWMPNLLGTHTWNESAAFQVIDGMRYAR